jgi:hypothetical protein
MSLGEIRVSDVFPKNHTKKEVHSVSKVQSFLILKQLVHTVTSALQVLIYLNVLNALQVNDDLSTV